MSEQLYEQISAFVDGELAEHETELLLKRLEREPELRAALVRYTAIGASLRDTTARSVSRGFAARVSAAIASDASAPVVTPKLGAPRWLKPLAGLAVAATVAGAAILGVQQLQGTEGGSGVQMAATDGAAATTSPVVIGELSVDEAPIYTVPAPAQVSPIVPAARLTNYVVAHSQYSSTLGRRNVLSGIIAEDPVPLDESGKPVPPAATEP